jgi:glucose/arabinose dehydrogenase
MVASLAAPRSSSRRLALCGVILALAAGGCGSDDDDDGAAATTRTPTAPADERIPGRDITAALAPLADGGFLAGSLTSGEVRRHPRPATDARDAVAGRGDRVARLRVGVGGQRGLVGLAAAPDGRAWTASVTAGRQGRLVVDRILPPPTTRVWDGPVATALATGGHLVHEPGSGVLVIGIGDLQDPPAIDDPETLNGKLLALDPDGDPDQEPRVLSRGWNNPFAFDIGPDRSIVVADNAPGRRPERIAQGDTGGGPPAAVTSLQGRIAPSGVVVLSASDIAVCGVVSGRLDRFRRTSSGRWERTGVLDRDCRYGVVRLRDGRVIVSAQRGLRVVADPTEE